ncbi:Ribonucleoside-diphosphate reductase subunit M2 [Saguinus oedipus]|uniref:Ribonucleoside-diphosphate reductase subunit M2 n=1 Tax=Saguinus oedipus TaxID=9490 RepID=A0ABQ9W4I7_SAGOE|nr:Ribonucleoside-diphosphate reductase subunit M2 [Saguinus oedipus]
MPMHPFPAARPRLPALLRRAATMLSVCIPLAPITDPQQLQLSRLKGLSLVDKENTPPAQNGTPVLASKTARRIFQESAELKTRAAAPGVEDERRGRAFC